MNIPVLATPTQTMTTRQIAEVVNSRHADVMRAVDRLIEKSVIQGYAPTAYTHPQNGQTYYEYHINERDSYIIVAQLCPEYTAKLVDYWMATKNQAPALPTNYIEALEHLLIAKKSEQQAIAERDHAIATKAQIGSGDEDGFWWLVVHMFAFLVVFSLGWVGGAV